MARSLFAVLFVCCLLCVTAKPSSKKVQDDTCSLCTYIVGLVETWVASNATEQQIEQFLDSICQFTPDPSACTTFVNSNLNQIIAWIEQNEDATQICDQLGMCNSTLAFVPKPKHKAQIRDSDCDLCKYVVGLAETWVEANATEQQIEQFLDGVCDFTPDPTDCKTFVNNNLNQIIKWIEQNEDAETICTQLGMCTSKPLKGKPTKPAKVNDADCDLCTYVVGIAETWLASNATEQQIEQFLDSACDFTPDPTDCTNFVNTNLNQIIQWIEKGEDAQTICSQLGMCNSTVSFGKIKILRPPPIKKVGDAECDGCQEVIKAVEFWMSKNQTETEFEQFFEQTFCTWVPSWQQTCDAIIEKGWPQVITWINTYEDEQVVCQQLGLCATQKVSGKISVN